MMAHLIFPWQGFNHLKRVHGQLSLLLNLSWISHFDVKNVMNKAESTYEVDIQTIETHDLIQNIPPSKMTILKSV